MNIWFIRKINGGDVNSIFIYLFLEPEGQLATLFLILEENIKTEHVDWTKVGEQWKDDGEYCVNKRVCQRGNKKSAWIPTVAYIVNPGQRRF